MTKTLNTQKQVSLQNPNSIINFANDLKKIIVENNLYTPIKGKNYVNVEGWQIAGAFIGVMPIVKTVENISDDKAIKYRAEVELVNIGTDKVVGYGVAVCSNKEVGKGGFEEYAVASMAQTRATGKAYRLSIGWLLKMAGYETTPVEEVENVKTSTQDKEPNQEKLAHYEEELKAAENLSELQNVFVSIPAEYKSKLNPLKDELKIKLGAN